MDKSQSFISASRHFLCEELPSYWEELTQKEIYEFLNYNKSEIMMDIEDERIWEYIETLALDMMDIIEKFKHKS